MKLLDELDVYIDLRAAGESEPEASLVGSLRASFQGSSRALGGLRFEYARSFLENQRRIALSPGLPLVRGPQYLEANEGLPDIFADSAPDDWGQSVLRQRVNLEAPGTQIGQFDFLVLISDEHRTGALRYKNLNGDWVGPVNAPQSGIDLYDRAAAITRIAQRFERHEATPADIDFLGAAGSTLGGARPKVVISDQGKHWLLKLPSSRDVNTDTEAWEAVALRLAQAAGIRVPSHKIFSSKEGGSALLIERFDRDGQRRLHYMSAMTALGAVPGSVETYEDLADVLVDLNAPRADLQELFVRVAFNVLISNRDDHWRNHGFIYDSGWRLSPIFDVNPVRATSQIMSRPINAKDTPSNRQIALLLENCDVYGLSPALAARKLVPLADSFTRWQEIATNCGLSRPEIESMSSAFRDDQHEVLGAFIATHLPSGF